MECAALGNGPILAGLISGTVLGFLFRATDAEGKYARAYPYLQPFVQVTYRNNGCLGVIVVLLCVIAVTYLVLWAPLHLFHVPRPCRLGRTHQLGLLAGVFLGWFLRYLAFRRWLRYGAWPRQR